MAGEREKILKISKNPIKISFNKVEYSIITKNKHQNVKTHPKTKLLKSCTGYFPPGQTTYIMGLSGAGKTTLLNSLCGRISLDKHHQLSGTMLINDKQALTRESFAEIGAYVMQDSILFDFFTVDEALHFAAKLKLNY